MRLYLAQHGTALAKDVDPQRPLSASGREAVQAVAGLLKHAGVRVDRVWHSGKARAEQTAQLLARSVLARGTIEKVGGIAPDDDVTGFVSDADVWEQDTLVVGHLPFLSRLVTRLVAGDAEREIVAFQPSSVVCLERREVDHWVVLWMLRPDILLPRENA
jgi:phosphohistidine phosphatase